MHPQTAIDETQRREQLLAVRSFAFERLSSNAVVLDASGTIIDTNSAWRLFGHLNDCRPGMAGPGVNYLDICDRAAAEGSDDASSVAAGLRQIFDGEREHFDLEYPCPSPDEDRWFMLQAASAPVDDGAGAVVIHVDITARKEIEGRLAEQSDHDELTGLPNRRAAIRFIDQQLADASVTGDVVKLFFLDLDGFKAVDDTYGRHVGDELLVKVASRAHRAIRDGDLLCRLGGDEFVLICPGLGTAEADAIADRLRDVMSHPFQVGAEQISIGASVGMASSTAESRTESLLEQADREMYADKARPALVRRPRRRHDRPAAFPTLPSPTGTGDLLSGLTASRAMADAIVAHSTELVILFQADGTVEWVSPASRRLIGSEFGDLVGRNGLEMVHPDDRDRVGAEFSTITELGDHIRIEFRVIDPAGDVRWIEEVATNLIDEPSVGVIVGNLRDITDRKRAEDAVRFQARLLATAGQPIVAADASGRVIYWNESAHSTYGWAADDAMGKQIATLLRVAPGWQGQADETAAALRRGDEWSGESRVLTKSGREIPLLATVTPIFDDSRALVATIAVSSDITERLGNEETAARLSSIIESSSDAIFSEGLDGTVRTWNAGAAELYGFTAAEIIGRNVSLMAPPDRVQEPSDLLDRVRRGESLKNLETVRRRADGTEFHVALTVSPILDVSGSITGASTIARDVTERVELRQRIEADRQRLTDAQASARLGSFEIDLDTGLVNRSDELWRILGTEAGSVDGIHFDHIHPDDRDRVAAATSDAIAGADVECTHRILRPDGEVRWVVSRTSRFNTTNDHVIAGTVLDITERHEAELELAHLATHDSLTGLPNRTSLTDSLRSQLTASNRPGRRVAVAFVDLDQFKVINDTLGHSLGDQMLRVVALRMVGEMRPTDVLGRFGGDEFVLIRPGVDSYDDARELGRVAERALAEPLALNGQEFQLTASIGVTISEESDSAESLLRDADAAMYQSKDDGRARITVFDGSSRMRAQRRHTLDTALRRALREDQLHLVYQPILELTGLRVAGFEALLRWTHPQLGVITPDEFIPVAESNGLILPIGDWVLGHALRQLVEWREDPDIADDLWVAVNVSARQLGQPRFVARVAAAIEGAGIPPALLHLEITESFLVDRIDNAMATIVELRKLGIRLSIDDFGTGYSSLSYLNRLPIDTLKIDQSFVQSLGNGGRDTSIVRAIIALAETLDLDVIAEGIELPAQLDRLRELGCRMGQGFLWSRPIRAGDARVWMARRASSAS